jgi:hypothetical protein
VAAAPRRAKLNQAWVNSDKTKAFFARRLLGVLSLYPNKSDSADSAHFGVFLYP